MGVMVFSTVRRSPIYQLGLLWSTIVLLVVLVITSWLVGALTLITPGKLAVFLMWLHAVPIGAIAIHQTTA